MKNIHPQLILMLFTVPLAVSGIAIGLTTVEPSFFLFGAFVALHPIAVILGWILNTINK